MDKSKSELEIITFGNALREIKDIAGQLSLKNLYSLLRCARGLLKSKEKLE